MMLLNALWGVFSLIAAVSAQDLSTVLRDTESLSLLNSLLSNNSELLEELNSAQGITLLAPSDTAWESYIAEPGADLLQDPNFVTALLQYHVLDRPYAAANITEAGSPFVPTLLTNRQYVNITGGQVVHVTRDITSDSITVYSGYNLPSTITQPDITFSSGFIHVISSPLTIPANITTTALYSNLTSLVGATQLSSFPWDNWSNATFFAPTNLAFSRAGTALTDLSPEELHTIMMYHVINDTTPVYTSRIDHAEWISTTGTNVTWTYPIEEGETIFVNEAAVLVPDVLVAGGVMHIMDNVLNPNGSASSSPTGTTGLPAYTAGTSLSAAPFTDAITALPTAATPSTTSSLAPLPTTSETAGSDAGTEDGASTLRENRSGSLWVALGLVGVGSVMFVL